MRIKTLERKELKFSFVNEEEFEAVYKQIFIENEYPFFTKNTSPFILDCGAHIGVSVLYFKTLYPRSEIIAFEANPKTFSLLEKNMRQNNLSGVTLINKAVLDREGEIKFYIEENTKNPWAWGDAAVINKWYNKDTFSTIKVKTIGLSSFVTRPVDLLKLDIEGSEGIVLEEVRNKLFNVNQIMMEFHGSSTNCQNDSDKILNFLKRYGFYYEIKQRDTIIKENKIVKPDPYFLLIYARKKGQRFKFRLPDVYPG